MTTLTEEARERLQRIVSLFSAGKLVSDSDARIAVCCLPRLLDAADERDRLAERVKHLTANRDAMARGEAEALKMMAAAEAKLSRLRGQLDVAVKALDAAERALWAVGAMAHRAIVTEALATIRAGQQPDHSTQDKYEHFLAYSGIEDSPEVRYAFSHGADDPGANDLVGKVGYKKPKACPECGNDRGHHHAMCSRDVAANVFRREEPVPAELMGASQQEGNGNDRD